LSETDAKRLYGVLVDGIGLPITGAKLAGLNLKTLKAFQSGAFSDMDNTMLKQALHILKQPIEVNEPLKPAIHAYADGDMPGSVRIACASNDAINVDGHFGSCRQFMIYQVSANEARLVDIRHTDTPEAKDAEDKNLYRAALIQDCQVIYIASVGGPAAAKIVKLGIHPIKLSTIDSIVDVVSQLQGVIADAPPPWLAKVMGVEASHRFRFEREATG
jgi:nitrogen fixation protein NifX